MGSLPWLFLFTILAVVAFIGVYIAAGATRKPSIKKVGHVFVGLSLVLLLLSSLTVVGTRRIGVVTSFGKPNGTYSNGIHLKKPWEKVPILRL